MREFLTYKSGKFYFTDSYDQTLITPLLVRALVLTETIIDLPILPELSSGLDPEIMYSSISGTAMIEGNSITGEDVKKIANGQDIEKYTIKDKQEIRNLIEAYNLLSKVEPSGAPLRLTEDFIHELHRIITKDVPHEKNMPGAYRNGKVLVGDRAHGGGYTPPKTYDDVKNLMAEFVDWMNSDDIVKLDPFIRAALTHYYFCLIHPFWDGNGRTARLLEAMVLQAANIKYVPKELSNFYYRNVDQYYIAFSKNIKLKTDVTPFLEFMLSAAVKSLEEIKNSIVGFIRMFTLRDFYGFQRRTKVITKRQYEFLLLLLENPASVTLKDLFDRQPYALLYRDVSTQTARRDLKKLVELQLLSFVQGNKYSLNMHVLG